MTSLVDAAPRGAHRTWSATPMQTETGDPCRWDTRVLFVERVGRWWWNAWDPVDAVERSGYTDTREQAVDALAETVGRS
jgi:hypothetical protein